MKKAGSALVGLLLTCILTSELTSCRDFLLDQKVQPERRGSVTLAPVWHQTNGSVRTLRPAETLLQIKTYSFALTGPEGATLIASSSATPKTLDDLAAGLWSVTVEAFNDTPVLLLSGSASFTIKAGKSTSVSVAMTASSGTGTVELSLFLPERIASVSGTISSWSDQSTATGISPSRIVLSGSGSTYKATYTDSLAAGTWLLVLSLEDARGTRLGPPVVEELDIFADLPTIEALTIPDSYLDLEPVIPAPPSRSIGINFFASQLDWVEDRLFADVMKTSREWTAPGEFGNGDPVAIDAKGWPTTDAELVLWHGLGTMNGTYYLEGECSSTPTISPGHGIATIEDFSYSGGKFSANLVYTSTDGAGLLLTFRNTGGGVRNVKLMRPTSPGSTTSYSTMTTFTDQAKQLAGTFSAVRFMWPVDAWNGPWQVEWSDRVQPEICSYQRGVSQTINGVKIGWAGTGMPWEAAIQFCNETGKDLWLNMPLGASDDYIRQLATLVRDTYTVPDGKVYWEYSNEATWDMLGVTSSYLRTKAQAEASAGGPVAYDGTTDINALTARYYAKRAAEMSLVWRSVWGDADMMTRVRPVASGQLTYDSELVWGLDFINNWFYNADGNHVAQPHPVSHFFYGSGASHYTGNPGQPGDDPDLLVSDTNLNLTNVRQIDRFEIFVEEEACLAKMYGLRRCAYEGGVWTTAENYLLPRITDAMIRYHQLWDKYDGDLLAYYVTTGGEGGGTELGFTQSAFNLDTPKYRALDSILSGVKPEATAGKLAPCTIEAADFSSSSDPGSHPALAGAETAGGTPFGEWQPYKGYLFRIAEAGQFSISLSFSSTIDADMEIMVDGQLIVRELLSGTTSPGYVVTLLPGLHALRIKKANTGYLYLESIRIQ